MKHLPKTLFLLAFVLRFAAGGWRSAPLAPGGDSEAYLHMAESFLNGAAPMLTHPPVYPLFLLFFHVLPGGNFWVTLLAQCLIGAACVPLIGRIGERLNLGAARGWIMAWVAVDPFLIYFSGVYLSETLFTFFLLAGLMLFLSAEGQGKKNVASGMVLSLATLCRSILLPFLPLFVLWKILLMRAQGKNALRSAGYLCLGILIPHLLWSLTLHHQSGRWVAASVQKGWNAYEGLNPNFEDPEATRRWQNQMGKESTENHLSDPAARDAYFWKKTQTFWRTHPLESAQLMIRKTLKFWRVVPYDPYSKNQKIISAVFMVPLLLFALVGMVWIFRSPPVPPEWIGMVAFILFYSLLNVITWTQIRYRIPIHPLLALLAGAGVHRTIQHLTQKGRS